MFIGIYGWLTRVLSQNEDIEEKYQRSGTNNNRKQIKVVF